MSTSSQTASVPGAAHHSNVLYKACHLLQELRGQNPWVAALGYVLLHPHLLVEGHVHH